MSVKVWDVNTGVLKRKFEGHLGWVLDVDFSPDGRQIVSASNDHTIRLWDFESGKLIKIIEGHTDDVNSVCFSSVHFQVLRDITFPFNKAFLFYVLSYSLPPFKSCYSSLKN